MNDKLRMAAARVITVDSEYEGKRLDVFLVDNLTRHSRSYLKKLIEGHHVHVDGRSVRASHRLRAGARVEVWEPPPQPAEPIPQHIPLVILHEDRDLIVLDKPEIDISATEIRQRVTRGLPIHHLVPEPVAAYIKQNGLYSNEAV